MNSLTLWINPQLPHANMVAHLVQNYAQWWGFTVLLRHHSDPSWILALENRSVSIPQSSQHLIPQNVDKSSITVQNVEFMLPHPALPDPQTAWDWNAISVDLLTFLGGQLWRAEEYEPELFDHATTADHRGFLGDSHDFFDIPLVDLWMRAIFEYLLQKDINPPLYKGKNGAFWLSFDVDSLRKWKLRSVIKHFFLLPSYAIALQTRVWIKLLIEALQAHFPHKDPWFTIPQMLKGSAGLRATFFWLGHKRDHLAERYDLALPEYRDLPRQVSEQGHYNGWHGSPLHAESLEDLTAEMQNWQKVVQKAPLISRQHFLRIFPGQTLNYLDKLGVKFDSSMGFNTRPGFRCGSAIPHKWWCFATQKALDIVEIPLILGDWNLHNPQKFDPEKSLQKALKYAQWVKLGGGIFSLDFHEIYFSQDYPGHGEFFSVLMQELQAQDWLAWSPL
ncbi:MAG: hypothetical protein GX801_09630 [Fibrobacter sp.]|nr:hypothetical protein [Fibrobacter sp.]